MFTLQSVTFLARNWTFSLFASSLLLNYCSFLVILFEKHLLTLHEFSYIRLQATKTHFPLSLAHCKTVCPSWWQSIWEIFFFSRTLYLCDYLALEFQTWFWQHLLISVWQMDPMTYSSLSYTDLPKVNDMIFAKLDPEVIHQLYSDIPSSQVLVHVAKDTIVLKFFVFLDLEGM